jgi:hypothetical protein
LMRAAVQRAAWVCGFGMPFVKEKYKEK